MTTTQTTLSRVYSYFLSRGDTGATNEEASDALKMTTATIARSRATLLKMGALYATTAKRRTRAGGSARVHCALPGVDVIRSTGRPCRAKALVRSKRLTLYLTDAEHAKLAEHAEQEKRTPSRCAVALIGDGYTISTGEQRDE